MDARVIINFKVNYKRHFLKQQLIMFDQDGFTERINVEQAWKDVKQTTIANCWKHTGIIPTTNEDSVQSPDTSQAEEELHALTTSLEILDPMTLDEYININSHEPTEGTIDRFNHSQLSNMSKNYQHRFRERSRT